MAVDPVAGDEPGQKRAIETARGAQVDVLDAGILAQGRELEAGRQAFGVALGRLPVGHDADAFLERQDGEVGRGALILEGFGHAGQAECEEPFVGRVIEHRDLLMAKGQWK